MALTPVLYYWGDLAVAAEPGKAPGLAPVILHGDLLLLSVAIGSAAIGEVIGRGGARPKRTMWAMGTNVFMGLLSFALYVRVVTGRIGNYEVVRNATIGFLVLTIVASASCIALAED